MDEDYPDMTEDNKKQAEIDEMWADYYSETGTGGKPVGY